MATEAAEAAAEETGTETGTSQTGTVTESGIGIGTGTDMEVGPQIPITHASAVAQEALRAVPTVAIGSETEIGTETEIEIEIETEQITGVPHYHLETMMPPLQTVNIPSAAAAVEKTNPSHADTVPVPGTAGQGSGNHAVGLRHRRPRHRSSKM